MLMLSLIHIYTDYLRFMLHQYIPKNFLFNTDVHRFRDSVPRITRFLTLDPYRIHKNRILFQPLAFFHKRKVMSVIDIQHHCGALQTRLPIIGYRFKCIRQLKNRLIRLFFCAVIEHKVLRNRQLF